MKSFKNRMQSKWMATAILAAFCYAEGEAQAEATGGDAAKKTRAPKTNLLDINRGRLPLVFVHSIRFSEEGVSNADAAKKYATSVGKVFDIRKGRNFAYVDKDYKATADDLAAATKWAETAKDHGGDSEHLVKVVEAAPKATPEEAKAQAEKFTAARSKGERKAKDPAGKPDAATASADANELLK